MTMKKTELEKRAGLKVAHRMKQAAVRSQPQGPGRGKQTASAHQGLANQLIARALTPTPEQSPDQSPDKASDQSTD